jgi:hypothetical protein
LPIMSPITTVAIGADTPNASARAYPPVAIAMVMRIWTARHAAQEHEPRVADGKPEHDSAEDRLRIAGWRMRLIQGQATSPAARPANDPVPRRARRTPERDET